MRPNSRDETDVRVDWAEAHHDIALVDDDGALVARARIDTGATGFSAMLALIAEHGGSVEDTPIAIETDKSGLRAFAGTAPVLLTFVT